MQPETQKRLEYLKGLITQYGGQSLHKYFGFTLRQFCQIMGIQANLLTMILKGQRNLTDEHEQAFNRAFDDLKVMERTENFKENTNQKWLREYWLKQKKT